MLFRLPSPCVYVCMCVCSNVRRSLGVVTSVTYRLNDIPPDKTYTGLMLWPDDPEHNNWRYDTTEIHSLTYTHTTSKH